MSESPGRGPDSLTIDAKAIPPYRQRSARALPAAAATTRPRAREDRRRPAPKWIVHRDGRGGAPSQPAVSACATRHGTISGTLHAAAPPRPGARAARAERPGAEQAKAT